MKNYSLIYAEILNLLKQKESIYLVKLKVPITSQQIFKKFY